MASFSQKKAVFLQQVDNLETLLSEKITCPKCNHVFSRAQTTVEVELCVKCDIEPYEVHVKRTLTENDLYSFFERYLDMMKKEVIKYLEKRHGSEEETKTS